MIVNTIRLQLLSLLLIASTSFVSAQISAGGIPHALNEDFQKRNTTPLKTEVLPKLDVAKLIAEDKASGSDFRFAAAIDVQFNLNNSGAWTDLDNGDRLWRLKITSKNAAGVAAMYDNFFIPQGAKLYMYSDDRSQVLGAYTAQNNKASRKFITGIIYGETAIIEYYEPAAVKGQGVINIFKIQHAYDREKVRPPESSRYNTYNGGGTGFGVSLPCHVNVNCPEGDDWQDLKRSVVRIRIVVAEGMGWCSGALINNTSNDERPYILTAYHCQDGYTPMFDFYCFDFDYETNGCSNPTVEPVGQSIVGAQFRSGRRETDYSLLELTSPVPQSYNPYFSGWNRTTTYIPDSTINIHHPAGDIKKISIDHDLATIHPNSISWNTMVTTPAMHHYRTFYEVGTFEGGSSGSPLFDTAGRILGQLNGGNADCTTYEAFFGRFSLSWEEGTTTNARLKEWLDPNNTGQMILDAYEPMAAPLADLGGSVTDEAGQGLPNVEVYLYDSPPSATAIPLDTVITASDGTFSFNNGAYTALAGINYYLRASKDINDGNGLTTFDIIEVSKVILGQATFNSPYKYIAADVNNDGNVTTFDIVTMRQVILSFIPAFPDQESWFFADSTFTFTNPTSPLSGGDPSVIQLASLTAMGNIRFIGVKIGDVNDSVDPLQ